MIARLGKRGCDAVALVQERRVDARGHARYLAAVGEATEVPRGEAFARSGRSGASGPTSSWNQNPRTAPAGAGLWHGGERCHRICPEGNPVQRVTASLMAVVFIGGCPLLAFAENKPAPPASDVAEIERTIRDSIGWALAKDRARLESVIAHDANLFIFHPDSKSTVVGWEAFAKLFEVWMDPRFKATHFDVRELRTQRSRAGDAAWFSAILDDCSEWAGRPSCWKETRWTGVLEKRDSRWVIVQMHFSFAADKVRAEAQGANPE